MNDAIEIKSVPKRRIRKIRRLLRPAPEPVKKPRKCKIIVGILLTTIMCSLLAFVWQNEELRAHVKRLAMNQYQLYLHGMFDSEVSVNFFQKCEQIKTFCLFLTGRENYCDEPFEHWHISNKLHHRIVGQDAALTEIDSTLQHHDNITAMAFVGTQGVGKTLALNLIQEQFQWHLNIQQYVFSLIESPYTQLMKLMELLNGLSKCGQNGLFIDSIPLKSAHIIDEFHQKLMAYCNENHIKVIVIYVIQIAMPSDAVLLASSNKMKMINFRSFNSNDLRNCINMESERLNLTIKPHQIDEMLNEIDPKRNGCKLIAAKLARTPTDEDL